MVRAESDPEYTSQFVNEAEEIVVLYSARVYKWNKFTIKQERVLVVTNINVYNFHKKKVRRVIPICELAGLTKALHEKSWEFVIHVKNDYDYRMESKDRDSRDTLFQALKMAFMSIARDNLPIFGIAKSK